MDFMYLSLIILLLIVSLAKSNVCPNSIICEGPCCVTQNRDYYCCSVSSASDRVYVVGVSWWKDHWGVFVGCLIASIIISVILSVLCCLFCNGCCWWTRVRRDGRGFVASGAFPLGAVVYSPYPPPWHDESSVSSTNATYDRQHRVHFSDSKS